MNRSNYTNDCDTDPLDLGRWRARVASAIRGRRGQEFLRELAAAMDALPDKLLIAGQLVDEEGDCCSIGAVCKARGIDTAGMDADGVEYTAEWLGAPWPLAAEIAYLNDYWPDETPAARWQRMRRWVDRHITQETGK